MFDQYCIVVYITIHLPIRTHLYLEAHGQWINIVIHIEICGSIHKVHFCIIFDAIASYCSMHGYNKYSSSCSSCCWWCVIGTDVANVTRVNRQYNISPTCSLIQYCFYFIISFCCVVLGGYDKCIFVIWYWTMPNANS